MPTTVTATDACRLHDHISHCLDGPLKAPGATGRAALREFKAVCTCDVVVPVVAPFPPVLAAGWGPALRYGDWIHATPTPYRQARGTRRSVPHSGLRVEEPDRKPRAPNQVDFLRRPARHEVAHAEESRYARVRDSNQQLRSCSSSRKLLVLWMCQRKVWRQVCAWRSDNTAASGRALQS